MSVIVDEEKCTGCGTCEAVCPAEAIKIIDNKSVVDDGECIECRVCVLDECPEGALSMEN